MKLQDYCPKSFLEVPETYVPRAKFPVIDVHTHWGELLLGKDFASRYDTAAAVAALQRCGIQKVVNLDLGFGDQRERMLRKTAGFEDFFIHFGTVDVSRFETPGFERQAVSSLEAGVKNANLRGIKLWKPIGLGYQDAQGNYLRPDDPRLDCIYDTAAALNIPVLFHIADPAAFFTPVDRFNERYEELCGHPDWSFADSRFYSFHALMDMQAHMLETHPRTTYIIAHCGSYAENLAQVSTWLDRYPNMNVDIAARISELGRQPYTAKKFFETYADRILFGTDHSPLDTPCHPTYFRFLETLDEYFNPTGVEGEVGQGRWNIYGLGLSDDTLKKIYYQNAERLLAMKD